MSSSDAPPTAGMLAGQVRDVLAAVDAVVAHETATEIDPATVDALVTAAIRLQYSYSLTHPGAMLDPVSVSPSEALTLIDTLLHTHDVGTFDLTLWLARTRDR